MGMFTHPRGDAHCHTGTQPPSGAGQCLPHSVSLATQQEQLNLAAVVVADPEQPGRYDAAFVEHHQVAGAQIFEDIREPAVFRRPTVPAHYHQAG